MGTYTGASNHVLLFLIYLTRSMISDPDPLGPFRNHWFDDYFDLQEYVRARR